MEIQDGCVISPGRVNLLGEHVDYNEGVVLPAAIDRSVKIQFTRRKDRLVQLSALDLDHQCTFNLLDLDRKIDNNGNPLPSWALYPAGVLWMLQQRGYAVSGFNASYRSDIPIGAGLSSSAAVEVGFAVVGQVLGGWQIDRLTLARICQAAEINYAGVNCGLMDQFACASGVPDHLLMFDTRTYESRAIPLPQNTTLVIADSTIRRSLINSAYNDRRKDCDTAVKYYQAIYPEVKSLRDLSPAQFQAHAHHLPDDVRRHALHVVEEIARVERAIQYLDSGDAEQFGKLMFETHDSLRDLFEVSCRELDILVDLAHGFDGCLGARLTGAGFGGCTINLVRKDRVNEFIEFLKTAYQKETGLQASIFRTHPSRGASLKSSSAYRSAAASIPKVYAIDAHELSKTFVSRHGFWRRTSKSTVAVDKISFSVEKGELFGLLGPNGAGKTTTVKMLSTLLLPTSGTISIFGRDILRDTNEIRRHIGFTFGGARGLYGRLTAVENLRYFAELYALPPEVTRRRIPELLEIVGLEGRGNDRVETFSSGMQQRLHLARALLHDPELIFLDEPTVGIDPVGARELRATVKQLIGHGKTILLTTHYMAEADELCDRIAIIKQGHIIAMDTPASLKKKISSDSIIEVKVEAANLPAVQNTLSRLGSLAAVSYSENNFLKGISITTPQPGAVIELLSPLLTQNVIQNLEVRNQTLEDVYISLIKGDIE